VNGALVVDVPFLRQRQFEVLTTYHQLGQPLPGALTALALGTTPTVTDLLARQIIARQQIGAAATAEVEQLLLLQNQDGGFGADQDHPSNVLDTAVALEALADVAPKSDAAVKALSWLVAQQGADGHWDRANVTPQYTDIVISAIATHAVWRYRAHFVVNQYVEKGRQWLSGQKNSGGNWDNTLQTAHALLSILPGLTDASSEQAAIAALAAAQLPNGSWEGDAYLTALALRVLFAAAQETVNPDLASVRGTVIDADSGSPIAGATITLGKANLSTTTDAQGKFSFTHLEAGAEQLGVTATGYRVLNSALGLQAGQQLDLGEIRLVPGAGADVVVTGTAKYWNDTTGEVAANNVLIQVGSLQTRTDSSGNFRLAGIPAGLSTLTATYNSNYPMVVVDFTGQAGETVSLNILFKQNNTATNKQVTFIVTDADTGLPLRNVRIWVNPATTMLLNLYTDAAGKAVTTRNFVDGLNLVEFYLNSTYERLLLPLNLTGWMDIEVPVVLKRAEQTGGFLKGVVTDAQSQIPLADVTVRIPSRGWETKTDAQGNYQLPIRSTDIFSNEPIYFEKTGYDPLSMVISVNYNTTVLNVALRPETNSQNVASLKVSVTERLGGQALIGAEVTLTGQNTLTTPTGADGVVVIAPLREGDTQVQINMPGYESAYAAFKVVTGQSYELPVELLAQSTPTLNLYGVVFDAATRQPLPGATVSVSGDYTDTGVTNAQGRYEFVDVPRGNLMIHAQHNQYHAASLPVNFQGTTEVNAALDPLWVGGSKTWRVQGIIVDAQDLERLSGASILLQEVIPGSSILAEQNGVSDAQGNFSFLGLSHKDARLMIAMPGYDTAVVPFRNDSLSTEQPLGMIRLNRSYNAALPDLMLKSPDRAAFMVDPDTFVGNGSIAITVRNNSNYYAGSFNVTAFVDVNNNQVWDDGVDLVIDNARVNGLGQQQEQLVTFTARNVPLAFRDAPIYVMVDSGFEVVESIKGNNLMAVAPSCVSGEGLQDVAVCVDTSGSVSNLYELEMEGVIKAVENPKNIGCVNRTVSIWFDS